MGCPQHAVPGASAAPMGNALDPSEPLAEEGSTPLGIARIMDPALLPTMARAESPTIAAAANAAVDSKPCVAFQWGSGGRKTILGGREKRRMRAHGT